MNKDYNFGAQESDSESGDWIKTCKFYCLECSHDDYDALRQKTLISTASRESKPIHKYFVHFSNMKIETGKLDTIVTRTKLVLVVYANDKRETNHIFVINRDKIKTFDSENFRSIDDFEVTSDTKHINLQNYFYGEYTQSHGIDVKAV